MRVNRIPVELPVNDQHFPSARRHRLVKVLDVARLCPVWRLSASFSSWHDFIAAMTIQRIAESARRV